MRRSAEERVYKNECRKPKEAWKGRERFLTGRTTKPCSGAYLLVGRHTEASTGDRAQKVSRWMGIRRV